MEEEKLHCENCRQEIEKSKFALHQGFCLKNLSYCPTCSEVILKTDFEKHLETHKNKQKKEETCNHQHDGLTAHEKHCPTCKSKKIKELESKKPVKKEVEEPKIPIKRIVHIDSSLGAKKCEYCENMFLDINDHYPKCEVKKYIEKEQREYEESLRKRMEDDNNLAKRYAKIKEMNVDNDEEMARKLQKDFEKNKIMNVDNDENMARMLQKDFEKNKIMDIDKDEEMARKLQQEFEKNKIMDVDNDEEMARRLQMEYEANYRNDLHRQNPNMNFEEEEDEK